MMRRPPARALYLDRRVRSSASIHAVPVDATPSTAVLICPPWGWDDITSYRARRAWAEHLAGPAVRRCASTSRAPATAAARPPTTGGSRRGRPRSLARRHGSADATGAGRVAAIGIGLGGLVALDSVAGGADIDDLVLWATPGSGRAFVRAERAFANLQTSRYSLAGDPEPTLLPDGWMEVNGFVLSADTVGALEAMTLDASSLGRLGRVLLLDHDGIPANAGLRGQLEGAGIEVTGSAGPGWGAMTFHPEQFDPPLVVFATVDTWLAAAPVALRPVPATPVSPVIARDETFFEVDGVRVREAPFTVAHEVGTLFGVLAEPVDGPRPPLTAIFLNAGAVRRIGPNRLWVEAARQAAAAGLPTLRVDLEGIGDSDGDAGRYRDVAQFYRDQLDEYIVAFLDALEERGYGDRFVLAGLCAGGFWAFNGADRDERAVAALMVNPGALEWHPELVKDRNAAKLNRLRRVAWWRRILRGQVKRKNVVAVARATASKGGHAAASLPARLVARRRGPASAGVSVERILDRLRDRDVRVVMAFSDEEPVRAELERDGVLARLDRWPNMAVEALPARDHTLRPIVAQLGVHALLVRELKRALERATVRAGSHDRRPRSTPKPRVTRSDRRGAA